MFYNSWLTSALENTCWQLQLGFTRRTAGVCSLVGFIFQILQVNHERKREGADMWTACHAYMLVTYYMCILTCLTCYNQWRVVFEYVTVGVSVFECVRFCVCVSCEQTVCVLPALEALEVLMAGGGAQRGSTRIKQLLQLPCWHTHRHTRTRRDTHTYTHTVNLSGSIYILKKLLTPIRHCATSELCACYKSL